MLIARRSSGRFPRLEPGRRRPALRPRPGAGTRSAPSTASRTMSAWPACRAVSETRCMSTHRTDHASRSSGYHGTPCGTGTRWPRSAIPRTTASVSAATASEKARTSARVSSGRSRKFSRYSSSPRRAPGGLTDGRSLPLHDHVDPPLLGVSDVLDQPADAQRARRRRRGASLLVGQAVGGEAQHEALLREVPEDEVVLVGVERSLSRHGGEPLVVGSSHTLAPDCGQILSAIAPGTGYGQCRQPEPQHSPRASSAVGGEHEEPGVRIHVPRLARRDRPIVGFGDRPVGSTHEGRPPTMARRPTGNCSVPNESRTSTSTPSAARSAGTNVVSTITLS